MKNLLCGLSASAFILLVLYGWEMRPAIADEELLQRHDTQLQAGITAERMWLTRYDAMQKRQRKQEAELGIAILATDGTGMAMRFERVLLAMPRCKVASVKWTDLQWTPVQPDSVSPAMSAEDAQVDQIVKDLAPSPAPARTTGADRGDATQTAPTPAPLDLTQMGGSFKLVCPYNEALGALDSLSHSRSVLVDMSQIKWSPVAGDVVSAEAQFSLYRVQR